MERIREHLVRSRKLLVAATACMWMLAAALAVMGSPGSARIPFYLALVGLVAIGAAAGARSGPAAGRSGRLVAPAPDGTGATIGGFESGGSDGGGASSPGP